MRSVSLSRKQRRKTSGLAQSRGLLAGVIGCKFQFDFAHCIVWVSSSARARACSRTSGSACAINSVRLSCRHFPPPVAGVPCGRSRCASIRCQRPRAGQSRGGVMQRIGQGDGCVGVIDTHCFDLRHQRAGKVAGGLDNRDCGVVDMWIGHVLAFLGLGAASFVRDFGVMSNWPSMECKRMLKAPVNWSVAAFESGGHSISNARQSGSPATHGSRSARRLPDFALFFVEVLWAGACRADGGDQGFVRAVTQASRDAASRTRKVWSRRRFAWCWHGSPKH